MNTQPMRRFLIGLAATAALTGGILIATAGAANAAPASAPRLSMTLCDTGMRAPAARSATNVHVSSVQEYTAEGSCTGIGGRSSASVTVPNGESVTQICKGWFQYAWVRVGYDSSSQTVLYKDQGCGICAGLSNALPNDSRNRPEALATKNDKVTPIVA